MARPKNKKPTRPKPEKLEPQDAEILLGIMEGFVNCALFSALLAEQKPTIQYLEAAQCFMGVWRKVIKPGMRKQLLKDPQRTPRARARARPGSSDEKPQA